MKTSIEIGNPGTADGGGIVLYDRAFNGPFSLGRVIAHELFLGAPKSLRNSYFNSLGWDEKEPSRIKKYFENRGFINSDAKSSPDEDFAHNLDSYLFDSDQLKKSVPQAYDWIKKHLPQSFNLKTECSHEPNH